MSGAALEEVSALSAIYCGKDEMEVLEQTEDRGLVLCIRVLAAGGMLVKLVFTLPPSYPLCPPQISVSSSLLSRERSNSIKVKLLERAAQLTPDPMIHQLVLWLQVLTITRYVRLIQRWTADLQLAGRLFLGRPILLLLQGQQDCIKEYLRLHRTERVDVDSSGKKCKERMMKVLSETPSSSSTVLRRSGFQVKDVQSQEVLRQSFEELELGDLYHHTVSTLL
ncbi:RWD domain-containing protein 3 [Aplochiton taeniatus]